MKVKVILISLISSIIALGPIHSQSELPKVVPYNKNPNTPTQQQLDAVNPISIELLNITYIKENAINPKIYTLDSLPFSGWTIQIFHDSDHKFRYVLLQSGLPEWQIGFYDNGDLDHDFHMKNGQNKGSQRMWRKNGIRYIDTYFKEGGIQHGEQFRWDNNDNLIWEAIYNNGILISESHYDRK